MSYGDWFVLAGIVAVVVAIWLGRRAAGRKRIAVLSGALSAAEARGYAAAMAQVSVKVAAQAANHTTVMVSGERDRGVSDRTDSVPAFLERGRDRSDSGALDAGEVIHDGGTVRSALHDVRRLELARHGAPLDADRPTVDVGSELNGRQAFDAAVARKLGLDPAEVQRILDVAARDGWDEAS